MHPSTATVLLKYLAREGLLEVRHTTFVVPKYPQPVELHDVKEAFLAIVEHIGVKRQWIRFTLGTGLEAWTHEKLFEKLFNAIFVKEKLFPTSTTKVEGAGVRDVPLPTLFIGAEKTQVRQIPLVESRPWPFKFLLELGGMIVCRPENKRDFVLELKQYLNNFPQYSIKVDAKECPDGSIAVFTYWFQQLSRLEKRHNVNVPS